MLLCGTLCFSTMTKHGSLISALLLFLLLQCGSASKNSIIVSPESLRWKNEGINCSSSQAEESKSTFSLVHINGHCSPFRAPDSTWSSSVLKSIEGDARRYRAILQRRVSLLASTTPTVSTEDDANVPVTPMAPGQAANYIIKLGFGTPARSLYTVIDTGSNLAWIPCTTCSNCPQSQQFDPSKSSTFKLLGCSSPQCQALVSSPDCGDKSCALRTAYGDGSQLAFVLSTDTVTVGSQAVGDFVFGCALYLTGLLQLSPGLMGFGKDSLSFVSQTAKSYDRTFSYCLPSIRSSGSTGSLLLGKGALSAPGLKFTPFLTNAANPSLYAVGLNGVSVGNDRVSVPADTIIDSGTVITRLVAPAYTAMRDSFRRQLSARNLNIVANVSNLFDTCYKIPSGGVELPSVTLHFDGGFDWVLPAENVLIPGSSKGSSVQCLAFAAPPGNLANRLSIIGNFQQQNFRVVYDAPASRLGIALEKCGA
uniref:Peptidase A1 domain-containing protein n=1 Tax=Araucaria cunninghamii TaxID=56994 RepID=A0A0D6QRY4_ARACU